MGVISRLLPCFFTAFGLQTACAAIFVPQKNEQFYDFTGSLTFLSTTAISLYYPWLRDRFLHGSTATLPKLTSFAPRQLLLTGCLVIWTTRLGTFLLQRALNAGGDSRFEEVKQQPARFTVWWMAQATWVFLVGLPVYMVNTLPAHLNPALSVRDYASLGLIASAFLFEVVADRQKSVWRKEKDDKKHEEKFITRGLWGISRHPNYVGEVGIWTGVWALSTASLKTPYFPSYAFLAAAASPIVTYMLLRHISGVPPLEKSGNKKFGDDPKWGEYKSNVPVFWPWIHTKA